MTSVRWMTLLPSGCNRRTVIVAVCLVAALASVQVAANDQLQSGDDGVLARGRRDVAVSSFWKRLHHRPPPQQQPAARDKIASFWKRAHRAHDSLASFWKRAPPGSQAFWKRFLAEPDDVRTMLAAQLNKKNDVLSAPGGPQQQRRANEAAGRRPEFNPTGW